MQIHDIKPLFEKLKTKRVGRGNGSGRGTYSGRGLKGQKARSGYSRKKAFEGGQNTLARRIPKQRGFRNPQSVRYEIVNLDIIDANFAADEQVDLKSLAAKGIISVQLPQLKVLGEGELTKKLTITAHKFSRSAIEKIEKSGSKYILLVKNKEAKKSKSAKEAK